MSRSLPTPKYVLISVILWQLYGFIFLHLNIQSNWSLLAVGAGCVCVYKGRPVPAQSPRACSCPVAGWWSGRECYQLGDLSQLDGSLKTWGQVAVVLTEPNGHPWVGVVLVQTDVRIYSWLGAVSEPHGAGFPPVWGGRMDVCIWHVAAPHWVVMVIPSPPLWPA